MVTVAHCRIQQLLSNSSISCCSISQYRGKGQSWTDSSSSCFLERSFETDEFLNKTWRKYGSQGQQVIILTLRNSKYVVKFFRLEGDIVLKMVTSRSIFKTVSRLDKNCFSSLQQNVGSYTQCFFPCSQFVNKLCVLLSEETVFHFKSEPRWY